MGTRCYTCTGCYTCYSVISYRSVTSCYGEHMQKILITVALFIAISVVPLTGVTNPNIPSGNISPTTNDLITMCGSIKNDPFVLDDLQRTAYCLGFIKGVLGSIEYQSVVQERLKPHIPCIPVGFSANQAIKMLEKYGAEYPERLHFQAGTILSRILEDAYPPCIVTED
jgi:hypothetical protein